MESPTPADGARVAGGSERRRRVNGTAALDRALTRKDTTMKKNPSSKSIPTVQQRRNALRVGLRAILEMIDRDMDPLGADFDMIECELRDAAQIAQMLREIPRARHPEVPEARS